MLTGRTHDHILTSIPTQPQSAHIPTARIRVRIRARQTLLEHIHRAISIQSRISGATAADAPGAGASPNANDDDEDEDNEDSESSDDVGDDEDEDEGREDDTDERVDRLVARNESEPLNREEIGKLLILTSRAYTSKIISPNQRAFLKTQIVAQHGMLRVVLQFPTLESIMSALKTISSSVDEE